MNKGSETARDGLGEAAEDGQNQLSLEGGRPLTKSNAMWVEWKGEAGVQREGSRYDGGGGGGDRSSEN